MATATERSATAAPHEVIAALDVISAWLRSLDESTQAEGEPNSIAAASGPCLRPLDDLVAGHLVLCTDRDPRQMYAYVDQTTIDGFLQLVSGSLGAAITVEVRNSSIRLCAPTQLAEFDGPSLVALWLGAERLGGRFWCEAGQATLSLPAIRYESRGAGS